MLVEWRAGAARGRRPTPPADARHGHRRRDGRRRQARATGPIGAARGAGSHGRRPDGPPCPGGCPGRGCLEAFVSGHGDRRGRRRSGARGARARARPARAASGREITGAARHRAGARRRSGAARGRRALTGGTLGVGIDDAREHLQPEVVVVGGGVIAAGDCCWSPRARSSRERALSPAPGRRARSSPPASAQEAGMLGAATCSRPRAARADAAAAERAVSPAASSSARRRSGTSRTSRCACSARCATPTSSPARTRAARGCCSTATASTRRSSATTSTTSAGARRELVGRMRDGAVVALVSDAGMPLVSDPGFVLVQACVAAGLAVEVLPGPSAALAALVASALPADSWRFVGLPAAQGGRAAARASRRRRRSWRSSRRGGRRLAARRWRTVDPSARSRCAAS